MRLPCPFCGPRDAAEFTYEGPAAPRPPLDAPTEAWVEAVYLREQPRGRCEELWRHAHGCRSLVVIERDNVTHEVFDARLAHPGMAASLAAGTADEGAAEAGAAAGAAHGAGANGRGAANGNGAGNGSGPGRGAGRGEGVAAANGASANGALSDGASGDGREDALHGAGRSGRRRRAAGGAEDAAGGGGGGGGA